MFKFFKKEIDKMNEIEIETICGDDEVRVSGRCHPKPNLCDSMSFTFGRSECPIRLGLPIETTGGTHLGYQVNKGKITDVKLKWKSYCDVNEVLVIMKNDCPIEWIEIDGRQGEKCVSIKERFSDCDNLNIISLPNGCREVEDLRKPDNDEILGKYVPACELSINVEYSKDCDIHFDREGDGVIEAIDTTGTTDVNVGATWFTRTLDTVRNNSLPAYMQFSDINDSIKLKNGVYKIWFESGIKFDQSVALDYEVKLQESINGGVWVDIPQSGSADFVLAGDNGNVTAGRMITYKVDRGDIVEIRIQEKISQDTSIETGSAGAGIVVERIKNSIDI